MSSTGRGSSTTRQIIRRTQQGYKNQTCSFAKDGDSRLARCPRKRTPHVACSECNRRKGAGGDAARPRPNPFSGNILDDFETRGLGSPPHLSPSQGSRQGFRRQGSTAAKEPGVPTDDTGDQSQDRSVAATFLVCCVSRLLKMTSFQTQPLSRLRRCVTGEDKRGYGAGVCSGLFEEWDALVFGSLDNVPKRQPLVNILSPISVPTAWQKHLPSRAPETDPEIPSPWFKENKSGNFSKSLPSELCDQHLATTATGRRSHVTLSAIVISAEGWEEQATGNDHLGPAGSRRSLHSPRPVS